MEKFTSTKKHINQLGFYESVYLVGTKGNSTQLLFQLGSHKLDNLIPDLLFPNGPNDVQRTMSDSQSEMNEILYKRHTMENNKDCFVVPIKTSQSFDTKNMYIKNNPNHIAFCFCIRLQEIALNKQGYQILERVLCIVSYLPLYTYFMEFLIQVINQGKQMLLKDVTFTDYIQKTLLFETLPIYTPSQELALHYYDYSNIHLKDIKILQNSIYIAQIVMNILLENSLVFVGDSVIQCSSILMLFLKNLIWLHQLIACIPLDNIDLLNVPVPLLGGIVLQGQTAALAEDYSNIVFVDLNKQKIHNTQDFTKSIVYLQLVKSLYGRHYDQIGPTISQFQQQMIRMKVSDFITQRFRQSQYFQEHSK